MIKVFRYELNGYQTTRPHIFSFFSLFFCKGHVFEFSAKCAVTRTFGYHRENTWFFYMKYQKYVHIRIQRMQKKYLRCSRTSHYMNKYKRRIILPSMAWYFTTDCCCHYFTVILMNKHQILL